MPSGAGSCPTILSTIYSSFIGDDCCLFSVIECFSALSSKDIGACLILSVACLSMIGFWLPYRLKLYLVLYLHRWLSCAMIQFDDTEGLLRA